MPVTLLEHLKLALRGITGHPVVILPIVPEQAIVTARPRTLTLDVLRDYATGEQFGESGQYWRGRKPLKTSGMSEVEKLFAQDDRIGPSIDAIVDGLLSKDPEWRLQRMDDTERPEGEGDASEDAALLQITKLLTDWHTKRGVHSKLRQAKRAEQWGGFASLRLYIPDPLPGETPPTRGGAESEEHALGHLMLMAVEPTDGGAIFDEHERIIGYYYLYSVTNELGGSDSYAEVHSREFITKYRLTPELEQVSRAPNPLFDPVRPEESGFLMFQLTREKGSVITPGVRDSQDHLNAAQTDLRKNGSLAGFPTWIFSNVAPIKDEDVSLAGVLAGEGDTINKKGIEIGPGVAMDLVGLEVQDDAGNTTGYATPDAKRLDPIDPQGTLREITHWRANLLGAFNRLWTEQALIEVSGRSRQEARADWDKRVLGEVPTTSEAVKWIIDSAWRFASWLTTGASASEFRVIPRIFADVAPTSLDVFRVLLDAYAQDVVSLTTVLQSAPVDGFDVDEERERLRKESRSAREKLLAENASQSEADLARTPPEAPDEAPGMPVG